jgi:phage terminase large subunit GpA-like protein
MVIKRVRGKERIEWEPRAKGIRNEPLDVRVYATGALEILNPDLERRGERRVVKTKNKRGPVIKIPAPEQPASQQSSPALENEAQERGRQAASPRKSVPKLVKRGIRIIGRGIRV